MKSALTLAEAAEALGITERYARTLLGCRRLRGVDLNEGRKHPDGKPYQPCWRIPVKEIERILGEKQ